VVALYSGGGNIGDGSVYSLGLFLVQVPHVRGIFAGIKILNYFINLSFLQDLILNCLDH